MKTMEYYISVNNEKRGPYSIEELRMRGLSSETLVMAEDSDKWVPAWQVEELRPVIAPETSKQEEPANEKAADNQSTTGGIQSGQPLQDHREPADNFQTGRPVPPMAPPQKKSHGCLKGFLITIIILAALIGIAVVTCPDEATHKAALTNVVAETVSDEVIGTDSSMVDNDVMSKLFRQMSDSWTKKVVEAAVDNLIHVDNHVIYSEGKVRWAGKTHTVSIGVFGHIFTVDKEDLKQAAANYYSRAERDVKSDLQKKAQQILNDEVIDPAADAIKEMVGGAINDIMQDLGIGSGQNDDNSDDDETTDSVI